MSRSTLRVFWQKYPVAETPLRTWLAVAENEVWSSPSDVKVKFGRNVDFVGDSRAIFDIGGNKFRLIVYIAYRRRLVLVKFIGTHAQYDKIDPETVDEHSTH